MNRPAFVPSSHRSQRGPARWRRHGIARAASACCGAVLLAGLGLSALPGVARAQGAGGALPPATLPQLRLNGVVAGQAIVNAPAPGAAVPRLTIDQASQRAILDWRSFDIGRDAEVLFRHTQGSVASTLNRIYDANPSVIQGRLRSEGPVVDGKPTAGGQLILINQNGILFDRGSQVNTQALLASTLNLALSNSQFCGGNLVACNSGAPLTVGGLTSPAFSGGYDEQGNPLPTRPDGTRPGNIGIGSFGPAGAAAPLIQAGAGGSVLMVASRIDHDGGLIASPDGQVVLAAGSKAYLAVNSDTSDITLRGLVVEVEAHKDGAGLNLTNLVRNAGDITADRGNVTLVALAVNQEGRVSARTAVQRNGSIYLRARTKDGADAGTLRLAAGSVTEVMPDSSDTATLPESTAYAPYRGEIRAQGGRIESHGTLQAAGGRIGIEASNAADPRAAGVYLGDGSLTSVAGFWSDVDPAKSVATFRVTSNELKNAPDQKNGFLLGATVTVDLREGSNILALGGYRDAVGRTVAEKAAVGGDLSISSTGSLIQRSRATLDASGGGYRYAESRVATSTLVGEDGRLHDITNASAQGRYVAQLDRAQFDDARWGQNGSVTNLALASGSYREAHVEGQAGGNVRMGSGAGLVLDGPLQGGVTIGTRQFQQAPRGASLWVGTGFQPLSLDLVDQPPVTATYNAESQRIGHVTWRQQASDTLGAGFGAGTALTAAQRDNVLLAAEQVFGPARHTTTGRIETGFASVEVNSDGRVSLPASVAIRSDIGSSLTLRGPALDLAGDIRLPAGTLLLAPQLENGVDLIDQALLAQNERLLVRSSASLSVAGAWLNNSGLGGAAVGQALPSARRAADGSLLPATAGGNLTLRLADEGFQTRLERGSVLDVSGGALLDASRRISGGRGGQLVLANGIAAPASSDWMQADLRGHALTQGGALTFNVSKVVLDSDNANGTLPSDTTRLNAGLFADAGFASFNVNAANGLTVADGAQIAVRQDNFVVDTAAAVALPSGAELRDVARAQTLPTHQRSAASLSLSTAFGALRVGDGAALQTDAGGSLSLVAATALDVQGALVAPGGRISLSLRGSERLDATPLRLGSSAQLSAAGVFVPTPSDSGLVRGTVWGGGSITLEARQAGIVTEAGSRIDVSGIEQQVASASAEAGPAVQSQAMAGHAGTLVLQAQRQMQLDGSLAAAGPGSAAGGSLAIELMRPDLQVALPAAQRLVISPDGRDAAPVGGITTSVINASSLQAAGFEKLRLQSEDIVEFQGNTALNFERGIRLDAPVLQLGALAQTTLRGATVSVGQSLGPRTQQQDALGRQVWTRDDTRRQPEAVAQAGTGLFQIDAGTVDFYGSTVLQGTALTRVDSQGDVRFIGREINFNTGQGNDPALVSQYGSFTSAGGLEFRANQLYPATRTRFEVSAQGTGAYLLVQGNGRTAGDVYSVAGQLSLQAPNLVQAGTVRAPQGQIDLRATQRLELASGSVTSVSGDGMTVLYGSTLDGVQWRYADGSQSNSVNTIKVLDAVSPEGKRLTLAAPDTTVAAGATVDLRGGGNVLAVEFVPGNGGDVDVATAVNTFAIVPRSHLDGVPYDIDQQLSGGRDPGAGFTLGNPRDGTLYDSLTVDAGSRVPAGEYVLLPTRFALLPGAYLVQVQTAAAYRNLQPGQTGTLANGETVIAAHRTARGTSVRDSQSVGVVVLPGSAISRYSDYTLSSAQLLTQQAERADASLPPAPWDAGRASLLDASALNLAGRFLTSGAVLDGRVGQTSEIDITGPNIAIVERVGATAQPAGTLQISSATLSALNASVLVGGTRSRRDNGVAISTTADRVTVATSEQAPVELPELLISARSGIQVAAGSVLRTTASSGSTAAPGPVLFAEASGALLRLSNAGQATVDRGSFSGTVGDIDIAAGAKLIAAGSLLLDATRATRSAGELRAGTARGEGGAVSLSASRVSLGETAALVDLSAAGLVLSNSDLLAFGQLDDLTLRAYERIDLLGTAEVGSPDLRRLTLDAPALAAQAVAGVSQATVSADTLQWMNRSTTSPAASGGSGQLILRANRLVLGEGDKATTGFAQASLQATTAMEVQGQGALRAGGDLDLTTPVLRTLGAADQRLSAVVTGAGAPPSFGTLRLGGATAAADNADPALGGRLVLQGSDVTVDTSVQARSGRITVQAEGGTLLLGAQSRLDASGASRNFNGSIAAADGGRVALLAGGGLVDMRAGAVVDVAADAAGGSAGEWRLQASRAVLEGSVKGQAGAGATGGSADIDLGTLADFSSLNTLLNQGGFTEERRLRLRSGDLQVAAADLVDARRVNLTADAGRVDVLGTLGRNTVAGGGRVNVHAAQGLRLATGSQVLAGATGTAARGGEVRLDTRSGALAFESGALVDVRAGDAGPAGSVIFGVTRDAGDRAATVDLAGRVLRHSPSGLAAALAATAGDLPASVDLEVTRIYSGAAVPATIGAAQIDAWGLDHQAFVASRPAATLLASLRDETGVAAATRVTGATEVQASGALTLTGNWDLTRSTWLAAGLPGTLTLRAAGDMTLLQTVGAPQVANLPATTANAAANNTINNSNHAVLAGDSWNIRMAAGADLSAADPLATLATLATTTAPSGNLVLARAGAGIRTGTGRIDLAAAADIRITDATSAIYTAGRIGAIDTATNGNNRWTVDGGDIRLKAGGSVTGPADVPDLWITDWYRRLRQSATEFTRDGALTDWWSFRPRFQQGVATLGGGDIEVQAGANVLDLLFALPTNGRTAQTGATGATGAARAMDVTGGGHLTLRAAGDVDGASFLVGRGSASVQAGGDIGRTGAVQGYLMGFSSAGLPEQATLSLVAGRDAVLQSVDNPTHLGINQGINLGAVAAGPSFHPINAASASPSSIATTFFTYAADSAVDVMAKAGDVAVLGAMARNTDSWRSVTALSANNLPSSASTAFPASLSLLALGGDILGPGSSLPEGSAPVNSIKTWPSATATLTALAAGKVRELGVEVSDLAPTALITPTRNAERARLQSNGSTDFFNTGSKIAIEGKPITLGRVTGRQAPLPPGLVAREGEAVGLHFDVQALQDNIEFLTSPQLILPARSRLRAGLNILNPNLQLQNLAETDVSEVRAVQGDVAKGSGAGGIEIAGPGRLLVQAGGDVDLGNSVVAANGVIIGGLVATGDTRNALLPSSRSARLTVIAGVPADVDLSRMDATYLRVQELNRQNGDIVSLYAQLELELESEAGRQAVLAATDIVALTARNPVYARFATLDTGAPEALQVYQQVLRDGRLPLGSGADAASARRLLALLGREDNVALMVSAANLGDYLTRLQAGSTGTVSLGGEMIDAATASAFRVLGTQYPKLFSGAVVRRVNGARLVGTTPLVIDELLGGVVAGLMPTTSPGGGSIYTFQTAVQTQGGSGIDLWAPAGDIVVGLTTPNSDRPVGIITSQGGAVRSVLSGNFSINQGKVLTAQGGDILIYTAQGSIDAGRGAKTSLSTAPPQRRPILDAAGNQIGVEVIIPASATGSGIQTLSSDADGLGPAVAPAAGDIYLFAPAGRIDAGEAGIRSSGNILVNAQVVLNASDIKAAGASQGVPQVPSGSLASTLAAANASPQGGGQAEERASKAAEQAARQATAARQAPKPTILSVEVLGFGDKNCKEDDKECFAK